MVQGQGLSSLTIGQLASGGAVGVETVRFYQRRGLLQIPERASGIRRYDADDLRRLRFIRQAQVAGFTLKEIKELLALDSTEDRKRAHELATDRLKALDKKVSDLNGARKALRHLASQCADGRGGPCPILTSFENGSC